MRVFYAGVLPWVQYWLLPTQSFHLLCPMEWYDIGHGIPQWEDNLDGLTSLVLAPSSTVFI